MKDLKFVQTISDFRTIIRFCKTNLIDLTEVKINKNLFDFYQDMIVPEAQHINNIRLAKNEFVILDGIECKVIEIVKCPNCRGSGTLFHNKK